MVEGSSDKLPEKLNVCVTGGAGFIGQHVVKELLRRKHSVTVLDNLSVGRRQNIPSEVEFIEGDITSREDVLSAIKNSDVVIHLAARVAIRSSQEFVYEDAHCNYAGTAQLLQNIAKQKGIKKFVFASSMAVYQDSLNKERLHESRASTKPLSPYGVSKLASENIVSIVCKANGIDYCVLRLFNTYGPGQLFSPYVGVLTIFVTQLLQKQPITIYGDGEQKRDFVNVSDVAKAFVIAAENKNIFDHIINIGTGVGTSINELVWILSKSFKSNINKSYESAVNGEMTYSVADNSLMKSMLSINPTTDIGAHIDGVIQEIKHENSRCRQASS